MAKQHAAVAEGECSVAPAPAILCRVGFAVALLGRPEHDGTHVTTVAFHQACGSASSVPLWIISFAASLVIELVETQPVDGVRTFRVA